MTFPQALIVYLQNENSHQDQSRLWLQYKILYEGMPGAYAGHQAYNRNKKTSVKIMTDQCRRDSSWSNIAVNKNLRYIKSIFSHLIEWEIVEHNPAEKSNSFPP